MLRALVAMGTMLAVPASAGPVHEREILSASYAAPTERYGHGILGDAVEWGALVLQVDTCPACARTKKTKITITLPNSRVFEDLAPRLVDVDNDGAPEVIVIETDVNTGAALVIYDENGKVAQTPHIGRTHRWLAPLGAADLDGDGLVEIAYIDRPHLAKTLRIWRFQNRRLVHVADKKGLTNHRIGEDFISGGVRTCAGSPEIVTASGDWRRVIISKLTAGKIESRDIGPFAGPKSLERAVACKN